MRQGENQMRTISEGDTVDVLMADGKHWYSVKVMHRPVNTGDLWYFRHEGESYVSDCAINPNSSLFVGLEKK